MAGTGTEAGPTHGQRQDIDDIRTALEDAILMGADESQAREALRALVASLVNPYPGTGKS